MERRFLALGNQFASSTPVHLMFTLHTQVKLTSLMLPQQKENVFHIWDYFLLVTLPPEAISESECESFPVTNFLNFLLPFSKELARVMHDTLRCENYKLEQNAEFRDNLLQPRAISVVGRICLRYDLLPYAVEVRNEEEKTILLPISIFILNAVLI